MKPPRVLVAGIGNIFMGDDSFGVEVIRRMEGRPQPAGVRVVDFGIRGFDLAYALLDGPDRAILVDALPRGGTPGTLYVLEPDPEEPFPPTPVATHGMDPVQVLRLVHSLGGTCPPLLVLGCEPATFGSEEEPALGLSEPVQAVVEEAVRLLERLIGEALNNPAERETK